MKSLKGHLLVATPQLLDPNFVQTVLLIFEHSEEGAAGVVLNRASGATITELSDQLLDETIDWDKPIHVGGPVPGPLMALHRESDLADREPTTGIFLTVEAEKIRDLLRRKTEPSLILANYAGWGPGQLDRELDEDSWYHLPADGQAILDADEALWDKLIAGLRRTRVFEVLDLPEIPEDPRWN